MPFHPRDIDGQITVDQVENEYTDTDPKYREYMREILYGRRKNQGAKNNLVFNNDDGTGISEVTTNRLDYNEKRIDNEAARREVIANTADIKASHFELSSGIDSPEYSPTTKVI